MTARRYRILNVFAVEGQRLSGNPLCVFEDGSGLDDATLQALALQLNLSETTFVLPSARATARVRIFTPSFEMPFAGHPTLGTAHVVRAVRSAGDAVSLEMRAGVIPVTAQGNRWTLRANAPRRRAVAATRAQLAQMLGLEERDLGAEAAWIDTGSEQLVVPLAGVDAVDRCQPEAALLERYGSAGPGRYLVYVWAEASPGEIHARFFFSKGSAVIEDPATGSACANLGGWFALIQPQRLPLTARIFQGRHVQRPSQLDLRVNAEGIHVSGLVIELGQGTFDL
jgi:trans-2,3-dihydro-3-hydroxyanthranilate isomerase